MHPLSALPRQLLIERHQIPKILIWLKFNEFLTLQILLTEHESPESKVPKDDS